MQRDFPPGLSESDTAILGTVKRRANILDKSFNLCGAQFGWTFIIGTNQSTLTLTLPVHLPIPTVLPAPASPPEGRKFPPLDPGPPACSRFPDTASAIVPVVGDALNLALGYFLIVRQARKSKYVYFLVRPPLPPSSPHHIFDLPCVSLFFLSPP